MIYLRSHIDTPFRDIIMYACSHSLVFEPISNGTQSHHLFTVIRQAIRTQSDRDFYQRSTFDNLERLDNDADRYDTDHLFDLVRFWQTREGKRLIYRKFNAQPALGDFAGARALVFLDGLDGFKYAAARLGEEILAHGPEFIVGKHSFRLDDELLSTVAWCIGEEDAASGLE